MGEIAKVPQRLLEEVTEFLRRFRYTFTRTLTHNLNETSCQTQTLTFQVCFRTSVLPSERITSYYTETGDVMPSKPPPVWDSKPTHKYSVQYCWAYYNSIAWQQRH